MIYTSEWEPDWDRLFADLSLDQFVFGDRRQLELRFLHSDLVIYAVENDVVIGYVRILSDGMFAYLPEIWVHSPFRRQGIGRQLIRSAMQQLQGQHLYVYAVNGLGFYEASGFHPDGIGMGCKA